MLFRSDKDLRLRSVAPDVRQREAKRRLTDIEIAAGQPGTNRVARRSGAHGEARVRVLVVFGENGELASIDRTGVWWL